MTGPEIKGVTKNAKVGDTVDIYNSVYICRKRSQDDAYCSNCDLRRKVLCTDVSCTDFERYDDTDVYFEEL